MACRHLGQSGSKDPNCAPLVFVFFVSFDNCNLTEQIQGGTATHVPPPQVAGSNPRPRASLCVFFSRPPCTCVSSFQVLWFPPTPQSGSLETPNCAQVWLWLQMFSPLCDHVTEWQLFNSAFSLRRLGQTSLIIPGDLDCLSVKKNNLLFSRLIEKKCQSLKYKKQRFVLA